MGFSGNIPSKVEIRRLKDIPVFNTKNDWWDLSIGDSFQEAIVPYGSVRTIEVSTTLSNNNKKRDKGRYTRGTVPSRQIDNKPMELQLIGYRDVSKPTSPQSLQPYVKLNYSDNNHDGIEEAFPIEIDVLLEALQQDRLKEDGTLPGEYVFATANRKVKLVRVGSKLHEAIVSLMEKRNKKSIKVKELDVGDVYATDSGKAAVFLGFVNTESIQVNIKNSYKTRRYYSDRNFEEGFEVKFKEGKLASLWFETNLFDYMLNRNVTSTELAHMIDKRLKESRASHSFSVKKKHSYKVRLDNMNRVDVPDDIIFRVRNLAIEEIRQALERNRELRQMMHNRRFGNNEHSQPKMDKIRYFDVISVKDLAQKANMVPYGANVMRAEPLKLFEQWEVENFST